MADGQINQMAWTDSESGTSYEARRLSPESRMWRIKSQFGEGSMSTADLLAEVASGLLRESS